MTLRTKLGPIASIVGLLIGMVSVCLEVWIWSALFFLPSGTAIRAMNEAGVSFAIAFWAAVIGLPISILGLIWWKGKRWLGIIAMLVCLAPLPVGLSLFQLAIDSRELILKE